MASLPLSVDVWQGLLGCVADLPMDLGEVQLFRLQVPGGTTRGRERVTNVRQKARGLLNTDRQEVQWMQRGGQGNHTYGHGSVQTAFGMELKVSGLHLSSTLLWENAGFPNVSMGWLHAHSAGVPHNNPVCLITAFKKGWTEKDRNLSPEHKTVLRIG